MIGKHADGPWRVSGKQANGAVVVRGAEPTSEIAVVLQNDTRYRADDHACLIAAAPELLEALKGLDEAYCRAGDHLSREERAEDRKRLIAARAAIAKAMGAA